MTVPFGVPLKTMPTTIRATRDIWCRQEDGHRLTFQLFPHAALQLLDHHWHTSGLIPHVFSVSHETSVIYEQDWMCTFQSITCFSQEGLVELTVEDGASGSAQTHVWIDRVGPSTLYVNHLITLYDQVLATAVRVLRRRQAVPSEVLTPAPDHRRHWRLAAPFSDEEREYFESECGADEVILEFKGQLEERFRKEQARRMGENDEGHVDKDDDETRDNGGTPANGNLGDKEPRDDEDPVAAGNSPNGDLETTKSKDSVDNLTDTGMSSVTGSSGSRSPSKSPVKTIARGKSAQKITSSSTLSLETFGTFLPQLHGNYLLTVRVGPQHLDYISGGDGQFADATWLAEVAFQALEEAQLFSPPSSRTTEANVPLASAKASIQISNSMAIQYLSFAVLGNQLHCSLHGDRICMVRSAMTEWGEKEGNQILVVVAKADPL